MWQFKLREIALLRAWGLFAATLADSAPKKKVDYQIACVLQSYCCLDTLYSTDILLELAPCGLVASQKEALVKELDDLIEAVLEEHDRFGHGEIEQIRKWVVGLA